MKIGLIYYSNTGNTRAVAEKLEKKLTEKGHNVTREEITISGNNPAQPGKFEFKHIPNPINFDALIFGAPVQAFTLNPVMKAYMEQQPPLDGKKSSNICNQAASFIEVRWYRIYVFYPLYSRSTGHVFQSGL